VGTNRLAAAATLNRNKKSIALNLVFGRAEKVRGDGKEREIVGNRYRERGIYG